jgi:hypothetical protein
VIRIRMVMRAVKARCVWPAPARPCHEAGRGAYARSPLARFLTSDGIEASRDDPLDCFALAPARPGLSFQSADTRTPPERERAGLREPLKPSGGHERMGAPLQQRLDLRGMILSQHTPPKSSFIVSK